MYGSYWDNKPEVMELCLNCRYEDCMSEAGCRERRELILRLARAEGVINGNDLRVEMSTEFTIDGETKTLWRWATESGMVPRTVAKRVSKGMDIREALSKKAEIGGARHMGQMYEACGIRMSATEWEKLTGVKASRLRRARRAGEDYAKILAEALKGFT